MPLSKKAHKVRRVRDVEVALVVGARFLSKFLPFILVTTVLVICAVVYAAAWFFKHK